MAKKGNSLPVSLDEYVTSMVLREAAKSYFFSGPATKRVGGGRGGKG